jgi:K+-transporting ATPase ATPase B chain
MTKNTSLFQKDLMQEAFKQSFVKLNPKIMFRNPVMFTVEIGTAVMFFVCLWILAWANNHKEVLPTTLLYF